MGKETMMKAMWKKVTFALASLVLFSYAASAQTDVALSLYGAFGQSTSGNNTVQSPANSAGGMLEVKRPGPFRRQEEVIREKGFCRGHGRKRDQETKLALR